jgi:hypothetical protein
LAASADVAVMELIIPVPEATGQVVVAALEAGEIPASEEKPAHPVAMGPSTEAAEVAVAGVAAQLRFAAVPLRQQTSSSWRTVVVAPVEEPVASATVALVGTVAQVGVQAWTASPTAVKVPRVWMSTASPAAPGASAGEPSAHRAPSFSQTNGLAMAVSR